MWRRCDSDAKENTLIGEGTVTYAIYLPQYQKRGDDIGS